MNSKDHKVRSFDVPWQQFNKLLQQLLELRTLHTLGRKNLPVFGLSRNC